MNISMDPPRPQGLAPLKHINSLVLSSASTKRQLSVSVLISFALLGDLASRVQIPISPQTLEILSVLLKKHPAVFDGMLETIHTISEDGKVDHADATQLLVLIKQIFLLVRNVKHEYALSHAECAKIASSIVQVIVRILCDENRIVVSDKPAFIKEMDALVAIYVDLVYLFGKDKPRVSWKRWFGGCCRCLCK